MVLSTQRGPFYLQCFRWIQGYSGAVNNSVERGRKCEVAGRVGKWLARNAYSRGLQGFPKVLSVWEFGMYSV